MNTKSALKRTITGKVVSNKMDKSIVVATVRKIPHKLYKKYIKRTTKVKAHDEDNQCKIGDVVKIEECRPISKSKSWRLIEVIEKAVGGEQ